MDYLLDTSGAFASPVTRTLVIFIAVVLFGSAPIMFGLQKAGKVSPEMATELWARWRTWAILIPILVGAIVLCPLTAMLLTMVISVLCFKDFARATGLFRERSLYAVTILGIVLLFATVADHWYRMFLAIPPLMIMVLAIVAILPDQPKGYLQRVSLALLGFMICGVSFAHLGFMANDPDYRPGLLLLLTAVELNDVFAFCAGKLIGGPKLAPVTSPGKTRSGALGGLVGTTAIVTWGMTSIFAGTALGSIGMAMFVGASVSCLGILGDLTISSIKRDLGIKDMGTTLAGHGGFLDRFNSLVWVAPAVFHFIGAFIAWGQDRPIQIFTGGN